MSTRLLAREPLVSVLLPVHDGAATIGQCIRSLTAQTLRPIEIIAVDDGSSDKTAALLTAAAIRDPRVVVLHQRHGGIVSALQRAAAAARAPVLARMDADDTCTPDRLARQLRMLRRRPDLGVVGCLVQTFSDGVVSAGWRQYEDWLNRRRTSNEIVRDLFVESPLAHPSALIRRAAFDAVGGYRDFDGPEDYDLWLRLVGAGWPLAKVPAVLLAWRDHPGRLTRTDPRYRPEAFVRLKAHHLARGPLRGCPRPVWIWGAGRYGRHLARALEAEGNQPAAFVDIDPVKIGRTRRGRPVLGPAALAGAPDPLVLVAVPVVGARALIRRRLNALGRREGRDYICCA